MTSPGFILNMQSISAVGEVLVDFSYGGVDVSSSGRESRFIHDFGDFILPIGNVPAPSPASRGKVRVV